jgi:hypothetical protein
LSVVSQTDTWSISDSDSSSLNTWTSVYELDSETRTVTTTSPEGRSRLLTLNEHGQVLRVESPESTQEYPPMVMDYDDKGRIETIAVGSGCPSTPCRTTTYSYDAAGNVESISAPEGMEWWFDKRSATSTSMWVSAAFKVRRVPVETNSWQGSRYSWGGNRGEAIVAAP